MGINLVVAVTDRQWYETLRQEDNLNEINFWSPSAQNFRALQHGELFLFKLRKTSMICGGGIFCQSIKLPFSMAWETFGKANGAETMQKMRASILRYRSDAVDDRSDFQIGCRILAQPFFFAESDWLPVPAGFAKNIVRLKTYSTDDAEGQALWQAVCDRLERLEFPGQEIDLPRFGEPRLVRPRLGQGSFRTLITYLYQRRCAVTQERTLPALDAAHIRPYSDGGRHAASNGLLLRRDIHGLFDSGYVTVTPELHFEVSQRLRADFENGRNYYALHGKRIATPNQQDLAPDPAALSWHNDNCYQS